MEATTQKVAKMGNFRMPENGQETPENG